MGYHTKIINRASYCSGIGAVVGYHTLIRQSYILFPVPASTVVFVDRIGILDTDASGKNAYVRLDEVWRGRENLWTLIGCEVIDWFSKLILSHSPLSMPA